MASAVIGALRVNLGLNSAAFSKGLKQSDSKLKSFGRNVAKGMKVVGVAAAAAATGVGLAVRGVLNEADEMAKVSQQIGIPIDELSRLKHAADLSGVSFANLQTGTRRLSQNMNDAFNGVGEGKEAFEQLGISVVGADGKMKSSSQVMQEVAARFAEMPDGAEKTALAMDLMGRSGASMIPMLNGGKDALAGMMAEADALGIVFDEKTGKAAENFNDNLNRLGKMFSGIGNQIAADLAPHLAAFTDWLVQNAPAIREGIVSAIQSFIGAVKFLASAFTSARENMQSFSAGVSIFIEQVRALPPQIVAAFQAIPAQMAQIGRDFIAGLWAGIQERWQVVKDGVGGLASGVVDKFKSVLRIQSPSRVMMEVGQFIMQGLGIGMENEKDSIEGTVGKIGNGISSTFEGIGSSIAGAIKGVKSWKDVAVDALKSVANTLAQSALSNINFGGGIFGGIAKGLLGGLFSFDGGGYTGSGSRSGGVDGKGGFPAILHPNETVIDHTKGGMGSTAANQNMTIHLVGQIIGEDGLMVKIDQKVQAGMQQTRQAAAQDARRSYAQTASEFQDTGGITG